MGKQLKLFESTPSGKKTAKPIPKFKSDRVKELQELVEYHQHLYYNAQPDISDEEFDKLWDELLSLDPKNEIFSKVGADFDTSLNKVRHAIPMNSQAKVTNSAEFNKWARKMGYDLFITQFKLDGISVELQYLGGKFKCGVTRGDGLVGDDISNNTKKMISFVLEVNPEFTGAIRGEIILTKDIFNTKYPDAKNSRNMASGITKRKDGVGSEDLTIIVYDAINKNPAYKFKNEIQKLKWLEKCQFKVVDIHTFKTTQEVINYRDEVMTTIRDQLNFDIDGLVIKGTEIDLEDMKRARPTKQIAFKFDPEEVESTVINVEWSESGVNYTPIAIIEPVLIAGTTVQRASLANPNIIKELNLKIGSKVIVSKRGDIIPKIERIINTPVDAKSVQYPSICNACNTQLVNEGTRLYCPNKDCSKRAYKRLLKWIKKLEVKNFGELILKQLFDSGKVKKIADLYGLSVSDLLTLDRVGEKSAQKALDNLFAVKQIPLAKFIGGFALENIGETLVEKVVKTGYDSLDKISNVTVYDLTRVELFGDITANQFYKEFHAQYFDMLKVLETNKIKIRSRKMGSNKLAGLTFCFTGKLESITRKEASDLVKEHGGTTKSGVVKDLSYLVTNSKDETGKFVKAQEQGSKIISEEEFLAMIKE
ncbi:MAG: NAD-dependent DNA ligase LigA [Promethearchaeota archaeon]